MTEDPSRPARREADRRRAEARAQDLQREALRTVLRDPVARHQLTDDPRFHELVAAEVTAERRRQEQAERERQAAEARERAELYAPRQTSTRSDPWANDPEHSAQYLSDVQGGMSADQARARATAAQRQRDAAMRQAREVMWESTKFCGKPIGNGLTCRPATQCLDCLQAERTLVRDGDSDQRRYLTSGASVATKGLVQPERTSF